MGLKELLTTTKELSAAELEKHLSNHGAGEEEKRKRSDSQVSNSSTTRGPSTARQGKRVDYQSLQAIATVELKEQMDNMKSKDTGHIEAEDVDSDCD